MTGLYKIEFNNADNYIVVRYTDKDVFDKFASGYKRILDLIEASRKREALIRKKHSLNPAEMKDRKDISAMMEIGEEYIKLSGEGIKIIDGVFGDGTIKKYFQRFYDEDSEFMPWDECFLDFLKQITPAMEKVFGKRIDKYDKKRVRRLQNKL